VEPAAGSGRALLMLLMRHAWAGHRDEWDGHDHERPLDDRGYEQAAALVKRLEPYRIEAIMTSPYVRCVATVEPLAAARGLEVELRDELTEEQHYTDGPSFLRSVAGRDVLVCGHGGLELGVPGAPRFEKGDVLVLDETLAVVNRFDTP
jgi:8-oxo-(d)GTP phosphatase